MFLLPFRVPRFPCRVLRRLRGQLFKLMDENNSSDKDDSSDFECFNLDPIAFLLTKFPQKFLALLTVCTLSIAKLIEKLSKYSGRIHSQ